MIYFVGGKRAGIVTSQIHTTGGVHPHFILTSSASDAQKILEPGWIGDVSVWYSCGEMPSSAR